MARHQREGVRGANPARTTAASHPRSGAVERPGEEETAGFLFYQKRGLPLAGAPCARTVTLTQIGPWRSHIYKEEIECRHSRPAGKKRARQCRHWRAFVNLTRRSTFPGQSVPPRGSELPARAA